MPAADADGPDNCNGTMAMMATLDWLGARLGQKPDLVWCVLAQDGRFHTERPFAPCLIVVWV